MSKRSMQKVVGYVLIIGSLLIGLYLISWTFGLKPIDSIITILKARDGVNSYVEIMKQVMKSIVGFSYSVVMIAICQRIGRYLVNKSKNW